MQNGETRSLDEKHGERRSYEWMRVLRQGRNMTQFKKTDEKIDKSKHIDQFLAHCANGRNYLHLLPHPQTGNVGIYNTWLDIKTGLTILRN